MKVCLISVPTAAELATSTSKMTAKARELAQHPPLGILTLAAALDQHGIEHEVFDLNRQFCDYRERECGGPTLAERFEQAGSELQRVDADVAGFSTLSNTYPVTIRLARLVKSACPEKVVILGGPQAAAVDVETLRAFSFVDIVVRGEAEETLPRLVEEGASPDRLERVAGITFRRRGDIVRTPDAAPVDFDQVPIPAFRLWPPTRDLPSLPIEAGRGCPFSCTFCSTSTFFRRRFRLKTPARILGEMRYLRAEFGVTSFSLMHDCFTADRGKTVAFCNALLDAGEGFEWTCSARTDCLDVELLRLMAHAGCVGVFLGVESGSPNVQREIQKNLDLKRAREIIGCADALRMRTVVSMIGGFPDETRDDLDCTLDFLLDSVRFTETEPQFHLLAPLAGSEIYERRRGALVWDHAHSDMAFQGWRQDASDRELVLAHPDVFPHFYSIANPFLSRRYLAELRDFLLCGLSRFRWLMLALNDSGGPLLRIFEQWLRWRSSPGSSPRDARYYADTAFHRDFLDFVRDACLDGAAGKIAVKTLLDYEEAVERRGTAPSAAPATATASASSDLDAVPLQSPSVIVVTLDADYEAILNGLREKRLPNEGLRRRTIVADLKRSDTTAEVIKLTPAAAALLSLCDGTRTVREIATVFPRLQSGLERLPAEAACLFAVNQLAERGLVVFCDGVEAGNQEGPGEEPRIGAREPSLAVSSDDQPPLVSPPSGECPARVLFYRNPGPR